MIKGSKPLSFGSEEYNAPLANTSHLSEQEKESLSHKALCAFGTYNYSKFESDEEFEQALACGVTHYHCGHKDEMTQQNKIEIAALHRGFYYHHKKFRIWEKGFHRHKYSCAGIRAGW